MQVKFNELVIIKAKNYVIPSGFEGKGSLTNDACRCVSVVEG